MLTNIAAVQITPDAFIAAGSARLGVSARSVVPPRLELVVETVMAVPYRGQAIQPSAEQAENACSSRRIRYNVRSPVESWRLSASDSRSVRVCSPSSPNVANTDLTLRRQRDRHGSGLPFGRPAGDHAEHHRRRVRKALQSRLRRLGGGLWMLLGAYDRAAVGLRGRFRRSGR